MLDGTGTAGNHLVHLFLLSEGQSEALAQDHVQQLLSTLSKWQPVPESSHHHSTNTLPYVYTSLYVQIASPKFQFGPTVSCHLTRYH